MIRGAVAALFVLHFAPGAAMAADPAPPECLERAAVVVYLHALQDRVMDTWALPPDSLYDQEVWVRFRLADDGSLRGFELVSWTNGRLARSVEAAFRAAAPFAPLVDEVRCLEDRALLSRFENPSVPVDAPGDGETRAPHSRSDS